MGQSFYNLTVYGGTTNTWFHIALEKAGLQANLYVDGVLGASTTLTGQTWYGGPILVGSGHEGYLSNLRITNGSARYGGAFTPPTAPLDRED